MTRIMVVDDDPHIRELVRIFLRNDGFEIVEAENGVEALEKMESPGADLVVLDIMMPQMDGWELCRQLREARRRKKSKASSWGRTTTSSSRLSRRSFWCG